MKRLLFIFFLFPALVQAQLLTGLSAYYKLNETSGSIVSSSVNSLDGTVYYQGVTLNQPGKLSKSALFTTAGYIQMADDALLQIYNSNFTFSAWIYPTSITSGGDWSTVIGGEVGAAGFGIETSDGTLRITCISTELGPHCTLTPTLNAWNFVAVTFNSSATTNNVVYYLNGATETATFNRDFISGASSNVIARRLYNSTISNFIGNIDEVGIWKSLKTTVQLDSLYNAGTGLSYPFTTSLYNPVVGRDVRLYKNGIELAPKKGGNYVYFVLKNIPMAPPGTFDVYNEWNFENEDLGFYTDTEFRADFDLGTYDILNSHSSANIVEDVINGSATKVMRITHLANQLSVGFNAEVNLGFDYNEIYLSYNFKFSNEFNSNSGGKLPGLAAFPPYNLVAYPDPDQGFSCKYLFKRGGSLFTYHYDRTDPTYCPWSNEIYSFDTVYMNNGQWYNITERLVMNTFTAGVANADAIHEMWVDGRMIFQETNLKLMVQESASMKIDRFQFAHFFGGATDSYKPKTECYGYIDNIKIFVPTTDPTLNTYNTHNPIVTLRTPDEITNRDVYYDQKITTAGVLRNSEYGANYSSCIDEAYLVDAGVGKTVTWTGTWSIGSGDYLFFYDGNRSDSELIRVVAGAQYLAGQAVTSTQRYMFIRFSSDDGYGIAGWTGTLTFNP